MGCSRKTFMVCGFVYACLATNMCPLNSVSISLCFDRLSVFFLHFCNINLRNARSFAHKPFHTNERTNECSHILCSCPALPKSLHVLYCACTAIRMYANENALTPKPGWVHTKFTIYAQSIYTLKIHFICPVYWQLFMFGIHSLALFIFRRHSLDGPLYVCIFIWLFRFTFHSPCTQ